MKPVGIFGGTFDPIHNGHLITALYIREIRNLEKIIFLPAFISPLKTENKHSEAEHRVNMVKQAIRQIPYFECSDYEIKKQGVSYTIETIKAINKDYSDLELIIGYDNLGAFESWKDPEQIFDIVKVVVLNRKSDDTVRNKYFDKAVFTETPILEISSTGIRKRVRENKPIDFLVPQSVKEYIFNHKLYRDPL